MTKTQFIDLRFLILRQLLPKSRVHIISEGSGNTGEQ